MMTNAIVTPHVVKLVKLSLCLLFLAGALQGCAHKGASQEPVFFPPSPDEPRVQYLTGTSSSIDLAPPNKLSSIVTGGSVMITRLAKPYGVTVHEGKVYVCDVGAAQIVVVDFVNKTMKNLINEQGGGRLQKPIGVAVDHEGLVYVADNGRKDIAVYSAAGKFLKAYGEKLEYTAIVGVSVYRDFLLALDNRQGKIFVMNRKNGELLSTIGDNPDKTKNMALPNGIGVDSNGNIHVVNMGNGTVKQYDIDGNMLSVFGKLGDSPGQFTRPRGVAIDEDGQVFIVDAGHQVVQVFNNKQRILGHFGQPGLPAGSLNLPAGVAISRENLDFFQQYAAPGFKLKEVIFVTNQYASAINHSLAVYGLGEMEGKKTPPAEGGAGSPAVKKDAEAAAPAKSADDKKAQPAK